MKNNSYEKIYDYLNENMDEQEAIRFEQELKDDLALAEDFRIMKGIKEMLNKPDHLEFLDLVVQARQNFYQERQIKSLARKARMIKLKYAGMAAAAVILLALVFYVLTSKRELPGNQVLYARYYEPFNHIIEFRSNNDTMSKLDKAMQFYKAGSFDAALKSFLMARDSFKNVSAFYIGLCYLELKNYDQAVEFLNQSANGQGEQSQEAEWYLSLAYLAANRVEECSKALKIIINQKSHYYHDKAVQLFSELEKREK
jgi:tetratricopeptide (TPR) repeat protein